MDIFRIYVFNGNPLVFVAPLKRLRRAKKGESVSLCKKIRRFNQGRDEVVIMEITQECVKL